MGDKNAARAVARKAGVPVTPGSDELSRQERSDQNRKENRLSCNDQSGRWRGRARNAHGT